MSNIANFPRKAGAGFANQPGAPIFGDDGGSGGGGMEARIARLEAHMDHLQGDMGEVKGRLAKVEDRLVGVETNIATLTERIAHLPSKEYLVRVVFGGVALVGAIVLFADNLRKLMGLN